VHPGLLSGEAPDRAALRQGPPPHHHEAHARGLWLRGKPEQHRTFFKIQKAYFSFSLNLDKHSHFLKTLFVKQHAFKKLLI